MRSTPACRRSAALRTDVLLASLSALLLALLIDRWLGEPPMRWHPVVSRALPMFE
jgi:hypothetical protein